MAYKNITNIACTDKVEAFCRIRDFVCARNGTYDYSTTGIGWTLWDSSYAADEDNPAKYDWCVLYSSGEGGNEDLYIKMTWANNYINFQGYLSWDPSTHAGTTSYRYCTSNNFTVNETLTSANPFWVYGNLDTVVNIHKYQTTNVFGGNVFGVAKSPFMRRDPEIVTLASAVSAGSVVIPVASMPEGWGVGTDLIVRTTHTNDMSTCFIEIATITAITATDITVTLAHAYPAGAKVCDYLQYFASISNQGFYGPSTLIGINASLNYSTTITINSGYSLTTNDPSEHSNMIGLYKIQYTSTYGPHGVLENQCKTPTHNTTFTHLDLLEDPDSNSWRCFNIYNAAYIAIREV